MSKKSQYTIKKRKIWVKGANWQVFQLGTFVDEFFTKKEALTFVENCECADGEIAWENYEKLNKCMALLANDDADTIIAERMKKDKKFTILVHRAATNICHAQHINYVGEKF